MRDVISANPNQAIIKLVFGSPKRDNDLIRFKITSGRNYYTISPEINKWLIENCKGSFTEYDHPTGVYLCFSEPNDAVIFKLFHQKT